MLISYIAKAMNASTYDQLPSGIWYGEIPPCRGVWATGDSQDECRQTLQEVLEGWLILKLRDGDADIPVIDGVRIAVEELPVSL